MKHVGDITKLNGAELEPVWVITGGSPCQDLSVAGKRAGLAGERSGLFMEQIRIVKEMRERERNNGRTGEFIRPRYMVWENVPGALSSNGGNDFAAVLEEIIKIAEPKAPTVEVPERGWPTWGGYRDMGGRWSVAYRIHDAQYWGVPQRRRRISVVADFGGCTAHEILFERESVQGDSRQSGKTRQDSARATETGAHSTVSVAEQRDRIYFLQGNAGCNGKGWREDACYTLNTIDHPAVYDTRGNGDGTIAPTMTGDHNSRITDYTAVLVTSYSQASYSKFNEDNKSATLKAQGGSYGGGSETLIVEDTYTVRRSERVRRLTPLECTRLQGFPDGWVDIGEWADEKRRVHKDADAPKYKALGNSIALPFWRWLLRRISEYLPEDATLGSLFDGIGGFPLCWAEIHGAETCRWASEIEPFPIAVTKYHFGDE